MEKGALSTNAAETTGNLHAKKTKTKLNLNTAQHLSQILTQNYKTPGKLTLLVVQWLRMHLPKNKQTNKKRMHLPTLGTWVQSLIWEDSTCGGAIRPVCQNYWSPCVSRTHTSQQEKPPQWEAYTLQWGVAPLTATRGSLQVAINK